MTSEQKKILYSTWMSMNNRCSVSETYRHRYRDRGIRVCERWTSFAAFADDMGPRPEGAYSLDRIDNGKGYSKSNCRWATPEEQSQNKGNNTLVKHKGSMKPVSRVADEEGVSETRLRARLKKGHSLSDAVSDARKCVTHEESPMIEVLRTSMAPYFGREQALSKLSGVPRHKIRRWLRRDADFLSLNDASDILVATTGATATDWLRHLYSDEPLPSGAETVGGRITRP